MKIPEIQLIQAIENCERMKCWFGNGCGDNIISLAEERIGLMFPPSYKWWLKNYNGCEVGGYEILSLYDDYYKQPETDVSYPGDIVFSALTNLKNKVKYGVFLSIDSLEILSVDEGDETFYFDTTRLINEEWVVRSLELSNDETDSELYAEDFSEFLFKLAKVYR